jgi:hypothetical protein
MKRHITWITPIVLTLLALVALRSAQAQQQQTRGPSTAEERARAVKIAHTLEENPMAANAKEDRAWMVQWIIDIPDITVNVCDDYFGKLPDPPRGYSKEIFTQMMLSSTAFMIEHPDKVKDEQAVTMAGILGSIKAYQAILKQDPSVRWPEVDKLVEMRDQGKLGDFVSDTRAQCKRENEGEPPPGTVRTLR